MVAASIKGMDLSDVQELVVVVLAEHEESFGASQILERQFERLGLANRLRVVIIEESNSQPSTVAQALLQIAYDGPVFVKDSDNHFVFRPSGKNEIACVSLGSLAVAKAGNKSYVVVNEEGVVVNIVEKRVVSDTFCCGGYGFANASDFVETFQHLASVENLYISHLVYDQVLRGSMFRATLAADYADWGTLEEWRAYCRRFATLFVDLDGTIVANSSEFFEPTWGSSGPLDQNVAVLNDLVASGFVDVVITTSRSRLVEQQTREQLAKLGLRYTQLLMEVMHGQRVIINDYAATNPYRSCDAINLRRNSDELRELLLPTLGVSSA
jgi:hypothetical protein